MKRKNNKLIRNIVIAVIVILALNYIGLFDRLHLNTLAVTTLEDGQTATNIPYICKSTASQCTATAGINCGNPSTNDKVVFRTNGNWIAWDYDGRGLTCFVPSTPPTFGSCTQPTNNYLIKDGFSFHPGQRIYQRDIYAYFPSYNLCMLKGETYALGSGCDLSPTPKEPYKSNNQEIIGGNGSSYYCLGNVKTERGTQVLENRALNYGPSSISGKSEYVSTLQPGDKISVTGGSSNYIKYTAVQFPECEVSTCNLAKTGYTQCVNGKYSTTVTNCDTSIGEMCRDSNSGAYCQKVFSITSFKFRDPLDRTDVLGYSIEDGINLRATISSSIVSASTPATVTIFKDNQQIQSKQITFIPGKEFLLTFDKITSPGSYYVVVDVTYNGNRLSFGGAREYTFSVTSVPIDASFKMNTMLINHEKGRPDQQYSSQNEFYTNNPITIEFNVFKTGNPDNLQSISDYTITAKLNGVGLTLPSPQESIGTVRYVITLTSPGTLVLEGIATKSNLPTPKVSKTQLIIKPEVKVNFINDDNLASLTPGTTANLEFETLSAIGNLVPATINEVTILVTGGTEQRITNIQGTAGEYYIPYTFGAVGDSQKAYQFFITSSAENHQSSKRTSSALINVDPSNPELDCTSNTQCKSGYECIENKCVKTGDPFTPFLYILIVGIIIIVAIIVFLLFKRKKQPSFGGIG